MVAPARPRTQTVGQRVAPISGLKKATGTADFATDVRLPGMLHALILRSPVPFARLVRIDVSRALEMDGVVAVLTHEDVPKTRFGNFAFRKGEGVVEQETKRIQDLFILDEVAKFAGDEIAAVAAIDRETAADALEAILVEYQPLSGVFDPEAAMADAAPELHPGGNMIHPPEGVSAQYRQGSGGEPTFESQRGDVETGFREADVILERTYVTPFANSACMEPRGCVADWDGDTLNVWDSTQAPFKVRGEISRVLGVPEDKVRVHAPFVGGGFGNKGVVHRYQMIAALLAMKTGRPVRVAFARQEEFLSGLQRYSGKFTIKVGAKRDGRLTAISMRNVANWGNNARGTVRPAFYGQTSPMLLYRKCPNVRYEAYVTYSNLPASGANRGFGDPESQFGMESILDELTGELGIDPLQFRLQHCTEPGDELLPIFPGEFMSSVGARECLERGAERIGWHSRGKLTPTSDFTKRGLGVALTIHAAGHLGPASARVEVGLAGEIVVVSPLPDIGSENQTAQRQMAADTLNTGLDRVQVRWGETDETGEDFGIHGSRGVFMIGQCVVRAARQVDGQLRDLASEILSVPPDELITEDGTVRRIDGNGPAISFADLAAAGQGSGRPIDGMSRATDTNQVWGFAAHFAEVEVDTDTGEVRVVRLVAACDVGKAINPMIVEGQLEGAAIQGIGYALSEELIYDTIVRGTMLNDNLLGYEVPTIRDVPLVESLIIESHEPLHPLGAKGCGEIGLVGVAPAIANAVSNALGIRFYELPITPPKVLEALTRHRAGGAA